MRIIKLLLATILVFFSISTLSNSNDVSAESKFTGEEIYKGIVFGHGDFGEKVITNKDEYTSLNNESNIEFANEFIEFIQSKDSTYFANLKEAIDSKNAPVALNLLQSSGEYFDQYTLSYINESSVNPSACLILYCAVVVGTVSGSGYVIQPNTGIQVNYAAWALETEPEKSSTLATENPELKLAKILEAI